MMVGGNGGDGNDGGNDLLSSMTMICGPWHVSKILRNKIK